MPKTSPIHLVVSILYRLVMDSIYHASIASHGNKVNTSLKMHYNMETTARSLAGDATFHQSHIYRAHQRQSAAVRRWRRYQMLPSLVSSLHWWPGVRAETDTGKWQAQRSRTSGSCRWKRAPAGMCPLPSCHRWGTHLCHPHMSPAATTCTLCRSEIQTRLELVSYLHKHPWLYRLAQNVQQKIHT